MNLETLLEAARYVEQQELKLKNGVLCATSVKGAECAPKSSHEVAQNRNYELQVAAPSLESSPVCTVALLNEALAKSPQSALTLNHSSANDLLALNKARPSLHQEQPSTVSLDASPPQPFSNEDINESKRRNAAAVLRAGTRVVHVVRAGTREVHNKLEKNRRAHLKECFELLKRQLPSQADEKKSSNLSILHSALRYIQVVRRKERDYEHEMEKLAREKIALQQKICSLKKELTATWDHIDFNKLLQNQLEPALANTYNDSVPGHNNGGNASDNDELGGTGVTAYTGSTSSLSSAATSSSQSGSHIVSIPPGTALLPEVSTNMNGKTTTVSTTSAIVHPTLHLPLSQVMSAQGIVVSPTIQLVTGAQGLRVLQSAAGDRQLTLLQASSPDRPLTLVQTAATAHLDLSATGLSNSLQEATAITTTASLHKLVPSGVTLMSTSGGGSFRTLSKSLTLPNGLSLCSAAVSLASIKKPNNTENQSGNVADLVSVHPPLTGLNPVTPLVVSQNNQLTHIIAGTTQINGKMVTPILKSMGQVPLPLINSQYLSTATFVKPDGSHSASGSSVTTASIVSLPPTSS